MNMPGFTAEASLFNGDIHYQTTTTATVYGGLVQPAISDLYILRNFCHLEYRCYFYHPVFGCLFGGWEYVCQQVVMEYSHQFHRFNCLKRVCSFGGVDDSGVPVYECWWVSAIC